MRKYAASRPRWVSRTKRGSRNGACWQCLGDDWSGEIGAGMSHSWNTNHLRYEVFAEVAGSTSLENFGDSTSIEGGVGFKLTF